LLGDAALPGEAQMVLEKGVAAGLYTDQKDKDRTTRLLGSLRPRAESDKKGQAQEAAEATKSAAGEPAVKMGEVYFGAGDYQNAVTAINSALQKGQIKHLDEAYVYLGRSQVQLKNNADAKKAFSGLKTVPAISPRVLRLWELYSDKLGS
jgi:tetratricopeptide (TPR) repeat protein